MIGTLLVSVAALVIAVLGCALVGPTNERGQSESGMTGGRRRVIRPLHRPTGSVLQSDRRSWRCALRRRQYSAAGHRLSSE